MTQNVVTFNFLAPITSKVSGGRKFPETHVIPCTNKMSAKKWAEKYLSSYFERGFELTSIEID